MTIKRTRQLVAAGLLTVMTSTALAPAVFAEPVNPAPPSAAQCSVWNTWDKAEWCLTDGTLFLRGPAIPAVANSGIPPWDRNAVVNMELIPVGAEKMVLEGRFGGGSTTVFSRMPNLRAIKGLDKVDASKIEDISNLFYEDASLTSLDLSSWDVSKVYNMTSTFAKTPKLTDLKISTWRPVALETARQTFRGSGVRDLDLSGWDTPRLSDTSDMFNESQIRSLDISGWDLTGTDGGYRPRMLFAKYLHTLTLGKKSTITQTDLLGSLTGLNLLADNYGPAWRAVDKIDPATGAVLEKGTLTDPKGEPIGGADVAALSTKLGNLQQDKLTFVRRPVTVTVHMGDAAAGGSETVYTCLTSVGTAFGSGSPFTCLKGTTAPVVDNDGNVAGDDEATKLVNSWFAKTNPVAPTQ